MSVPRGGMLTGEGKGISMFRGYVQGVSPRGVSMSGSGYPIGGEHVWEWICPGEVGIPEECE